ncbi:ABC transporter ATP-binding protein [Comamonas serinivorans]|uniref:ABC transporter ATP-binding protein n=1 Tax=Comamonas serinivorans TaxID=1082851 RepID=A0A1Y0EIQ3_9BURK|nr:ABC transporter ATP-binding protein [Comamonas serinivorans]ARU03340.1 ABC transporter ATP-binding protein [Comamonas serinivorans]
MNNLVLEAHNLVVGYGGRPVLDGVSMNLRAGEVLCLIGHNGAGKSTLLKTLFGLMSPTSGEIRLHGKPVASADPRSLTAAGVSLVPEGRGVFPNLSVSETLEMGMWAAQVPQAQRAQRLAWVLETLPAMRNFLQQRAGSLSGGQQQMVSIGRALLNQPRVLLMDEPSIGLAPKLFQDLMAPIREMQLKTGVSILLVEQNVKEALKIADRVIVMKSGALIHETVPAELQDNAKLMALY